MFSTMTHKVRPWLLSAIICAVALGLLFRPNASAQELEPLPALGADLQRTSVSGLSSGAYMAAQFQMAHAEMVTAAGIIAGGPYACADIGLFFMPRLSRALYQCMDISMGKPDPERLAQYAESLASKGRIGAISAVRTDRVFLFSGTEDNTVASAVVASAVDFYRELGVPAENIKFVDDVAASHAFVTLTTGRDCDSEGEPYIVQCGYDLAGTMLKFLHPEFEAPSQGEPEGRIIRFDQRQFATSVRENSLDPVGIAFVPESCEVQAGCRVHIAFHGCRQTLDEVGEAFVRDTGYLRWAASNRMIVLFPQAQKSWKNPRGCWDWWGYTDARYMSRQGLQISAVRHMLERIAETHTKSSD